MFTNTRAKNSRGSMVAVPEVRHSDESERATLDALHLAVAAVGRADYLATWNMRHLAWAVVRRRLEQALRSMGYDSPTVCTPEELLEPPSEAGASDD